jgi:acyl-CoA synthetase (AMP-forming)/AMP-acid ligase II
MYSVSEYLAAPPNYVVRSRWSCPIPTTDLCSYIFTSPICELPRDPVYIDAEKPETHNISLHGYRRLVKKIAEGLQMSGLLPSQRVLVYSGNNVFYPSLYLGVVAAGGIFTGANPTYTVRELAHQLKDSGASFLISSEDSLKTGVEAADSVGLARDRIFIFDDGLLLGDVKGGSGVDRWIKDAGEAGKKYGVGHWSAIVSLSDNFQWKVFRTEEETHQTAAINYSSG